MINGFDQHSSSLLASEDLVQTQYRGHGHGHGHGHNNANGTAHNNNNNTNTTDTNTNNSRAVFKKTYPVVQVEAPETLPEGYTFDVEVNHEILTVTVPRGGITKGQTFRGQTRARIQDERASIRIPIGGWKDSVLDFCTLGPFHPSFCIGLFCPLIGLGQIYTRLNLNWHGRPIEQDYEATSTTDSNPTILTPQFKYSSRAFKIMIAITMGYKLFITWFDPYKDENEFYDPFLHTTYFLFLLFCAILAARTRTYIRDRYEIQATTIEQTMERAPCSCCQNLNLEDNESVPLRCDVVEDYAVSCLCLPCTVMQMSRHTAPYDTYEGSYFSSTGLPSHAPSMV